MPGTQSVPAHPKAVEMNLKAPGRPPVATAGSDAQTLIEQAKLMLNQASRQQMLDPMFAPATARAAPLHPLARATAAPVVGERRLTDHIYQYTMADGRRFCFATPSNMEFSNRDGPAPGGMAVATNCPR